MSHSNDRSHQLSTFDHVRIPLSKTGKHAGKYEAIVDQQDRDLAELNWRVLITRNTEYAVREKKRNGKIKGIYLHRVIIERILDRKLKADERVDHIDGNGLRNTRSNLRVATHSQNLANRGATTDSISGSKGAHWDKQTGKWRARITVNYRTINLGRYDTSEEAHRAYCEAAEKYHGEFFNPG